MIGSLTTGTDLLCIWRCSAPSVTRAWNSATAYTGGQEVTYSGHTWKAKWWTQGDTPGNNSQDVWTDEGACS